MKKSYIPANQNEFLLYTTANGKVKVDVFIKDETVWLMQKAMVELFGVKIPAISKHPANVYETGELQQEATLSILETVQKERQRQVSRKQQDSVCAIFAPTTKTINSNCRGFLGSSTIGLLQ